MMYFLRKLVLFLVFPLGMLLLLFLTLNYFNNKLLAGYKVPPTTKSLFFGDSHVQMAINDKLLPASINLSQHAESYLYSYYKIETIIKTNPSVANIYLGFGYHSSSSYFNDYIFGKYARDVSARYFFILPFREKLKCIKYNLYQLPDFTKQVFLHGAKNLVSKRQPYSFLLSSADNYDHISAVQKSMDRRVSDQYFENGKPRGFSEINIYYLSKIIDLCQKKKINLIMLNTPLHPYYKSKIPVKFIKKHDALLKAGHLMEIDFNGLVLNDSCFIPDGDHVSRKGSLLTTKYLLK